MTKKAKTIYIKTFGCSLNQSDSEAMCGLLCEAGFNVLSEHGDDEALISAPKDVEKNVEKTIEKGVDVVIINSCTVKNLAESKFFRELRFWKKHNVKIIVAGCISQAEPELLKDELKDVSVIGTRQLTHIVEIVKKSLDGQIIHNIENDINERLNLPKVRRNGIIEILPISEGCMSNCAFCKTKLARGELLSYQREKIMAQFKSALAEGCKEFWITSQDNGCYGFDIYRKEKYFLPQLLNDLLAIKGDFRIRLGMCNPDHIDRIKDDLVETFKHPKMFKFLHIPIQSGNDRILKSMKRPYTIADFLGIIELFRRKIDGIIISTDMIVGFPGETESEFEDSLKLVRDVKFEVLNFSRFWARKGTGAAEMKQLDSKILVKRSEKMKALFESMSEDSNKKWLNKILRVLVDEREKDYYIGRADSYRRVILFSTGSGEIFGKFLNVKIVKTKKYSLVGKIV
jgi:threonylcarbamoyladenosine tRNA methylthiotransferase CDKAL1